MEYTDEVGIFSPDGRLYQVEYAQHASTQGSTVCINIIGDKLRVFYENRIPSNLYIPNRKIFDVRNNFYILYSGLRPDSYLITRQARLIAANYKLRTSEEIEIGVLARKIAEYKQKYTVNEQMRPLGLRTVLLGIEDKQPKLFIIEADGNYAEYSKCAIGYKSDLSIDYLLKNDGEFAALSALLEVVQKDYKKIVGYDISSNGCIEINSDEIKRLVEQQI